MEPSEAAALSRARNGDPDAFGELVKRYGRSVFALAFRLTGNEQDAEDVVQETFIRAYRQLHRFESRSSFGTWVNRIAANCAVDLLRSRPRRHESIDAAGDQATVAHTELATSEPSPDRLAVGQEITARLEAAMAGLSDLERAAFVLRHYEGESIDVIGRRLGLKTSAAKHSVFRAVRKMRAALEPFAPGTGGDRKNAGAWSPQTPDAVWDDGAAEVSRP
jgi:RNA polymerase sigma-70 factor (ECF subfamily)